MASPNAPYPFTTSFHLVSTPFGFKQNLMCPSHLFDAVTFEFPAKYFFTPRQTGLILLTWKATQDLRLRTGDWWNPTLPECVVVALLVFVTWHIVIRSCCSNVSSSWKRSTHTEAAAEGVVDAALVDNARSHRDPCQWSLWDNGIHRESASGQFLVLLARGQPL